MGMDGHGDDTGMSGVDKGNEAERLEDYLEFERHLERLQQEKRPRRPCRMTPGQAKAYRMAALFRSAIPGAAEPDPAFAARLEEQLDRKLKGRGRWFRSVLPAPSSGGMSRRSLLAGGLSAAAGLAAGAVLGGVVEQGVVTTQPPSWNVSLAGLGKAWLAVGNAADVAPGQMLQFRTDTVVGYVFHNDEAQSSEGGQAEPEWIAMSAACTHMGCIVAWNSQDRQLHCPCHDGTFTRYGTPTTGSQKYLYSLPRMQVRVQDGQVWVQVPTALPSDPPARNGDWQG
jgi:nitrite reductase/ring-hydroxylating ferredoxin subunit